MRSLTSTSIPVHQFSLRFEQRSSNEVSRIPLYPQTAHCPSAELSELRKQTLWKKHDVWRAGYRIKTLRILCLPRKLTLQRQSVLRLPREVKEKWHWTAMQHHQIRPHRRCVLSSSCDNDSNFIQFQAIWFSLRGGRPSLFWKFGKNLSQNTSLGTCEGSKLRIKWDLGPGQKHDPKKIQKALVFPCFN